MPTMNTWMYQNATAISPLARNAAGRVNRPTMMRNPHERFDDAGGALQRHEIATAWPPNHPMRLLQAEEEEQHAEHDAEQRVGVRGVALWNHMAS